MQEMPSEFRLTCSARRRSRQSHSTRDVRADGSALKIECRVGHDNLAIDMLLVHHDKKRRANLSWKYDSDLIQMAEISPVNAKGQR